MSRRKHTESAGPRDRRDQFVRPAPAGRSAPFWIWIAAASVALLALVFYINRTNSAAGPPAVAVQGNATGSGQDIVMPASLFDDGQARFYRYTTTAGREIRFFVMKSSDGVVRAAFDTCDVCYRERKGYRQEGDLMVCNNCRKGFRSVDINVIQGGCNPAPLNRTVAGGQVVLSAADLDRGAGYF